jgi:hypothetical protein
VLNVPAHWRILTPADKTPFASGEAGRPIRIVIDDRTVGDRATTRLLFAFGGRSDAEVYGTAPERTARVVIEAPDGRGAIPVEYVLPDGRGRREAVISSSNWTPASAQMTAADLGVSEEDAIRSLTLAAACSRHEIDALVTASPVLALPYWNDLAETAHAVAPESAAALLGLYLRAHNDYTVAVDGSDATFLEDKRFYTAAALATLPRYLAWLGDAVATWERRNDPRPFALLKRLGIRLGHSLRARDYFNVRVRSRWPEDVWDEALFFFETALVSLNGALDAASRFCHLAFGLTGPLASANWSRSTWREDLVAVAPELRRVVDPESGPLVACRTLVSVMRNYIHAETLTEELHRGDTEGSTTMDYGLGAVTVAPDDGRRLQMSAATLGGNQAWGLDEQINHDVLVLPRLFLQRAVTTMLRVLDQLMEASAPRVGPRASQPPLDPSYWLPDVGHEQQLRLLTGLHDPDA